MVFTADFMIAIVTKKWKLEKEKKFASYLFDDVRFRVLKDRKKTKI